MSDSFSAAAAEEAALAASGVDLNNTVGIVLLGGSVSCVIYGVTCIQTFQYYRSQRSKADPWYLRSVVLLLLLLDTVHQALILESGYYYLIKNYGNPFILSRATWSIPSTIIITGVIAFVVESFFVRRIWKFGHNRYVTATAMVLTFAHLLSNLAHATLQLGRQRLAREAVHQRRPHVTQFTRVPAYRYRGRQGPWRRTELRVWPVRDAPAASRRPHSHWQWRAHDDHDYRRRDSDF